MRIEGRFPRRPARPSRSRIILFVVIAILVALLLSGRAVAGFYTDFLWFQQLGFSGVFTSLLGAKIFLSVVFSVIAFVLVWINLIAADRISPDFRPVGPQDEIVQRYRDLIGPHARKVHLALGVVFALILGAGQSAQWPAWILFRNAKPFTVSDAQFHRNVGFFVFRLPFLEFLVQWVFAAIVVATFLSVVFHYLNGGIRLQVPASMARVTPQVKAHISVLLGLLALTKAAGYWLQQFQLDFSTRGPVQGATYTDVHAQLPAIRTLTIIMIVAFFLFIANIRLRGWTLPVLGVGLWFLVSLILGAIYPAAVQKFSVKPSERQRESPFIQRNVDATRAAMGLDKVKVSSFNYAENLTAQDMAASTHTIRNVRLWDPALTLTTYQRLQDLRQYYTIRDTDIDRYVLGGEQTQTMFGVRELNQADLPSSTWLNTHLQYTHGYGGVLAPTNAVTPDGRPQFDIQDVPPSAPPGAPTGTPALTTPQIYFGVTTPTFSIVNTSQPELDYEAPNGGVVSTSYKGTGGVRLSSFLRKLAFFARFGDENIVISSQITSNSRVLYIRNVQDRIRKAAPFLHLDHDPYAVILDGRVVWVQDAYTTTDRYPYAQLAQVGRLAPDAGLNVPFNYVRNSVKAVVDAYDGTTSLYVFDPTDPIIQAYEQAFPKLFRPKSDMPPDLVPHLRYPEDLFKVQTTMYGRYHITDPGQFYGLSDVWAVAQDPGTGNAAAPTARTQTTGPNGQPVNGLARRQDPYYLVTRLPNDPAEEFQILQPMVPQSSDDKQQNLTALMVAKCDPQDYGQLEVFRMPPGVQVSGPAQVDARIQQDTIVSSQITLLNTNNSEADFGNILTIPIRDSLLYIRPLYVRSQRNPIPEFKKVIVVYGSQVAYEDSLAAALDRIFPGAGQVTPANTGVSPTGTGPPTGPAPTLTAAQLLAAAQQAFADADAALKAGDLAKYQAKVNEAHNDLSQAQQLLSAAPPPAAGPAGGSAGAASAPGDSGATPTTSPPTSPTTTTSPPSSA